MSILKQDDNGFPVQAITIGGSNDVAVGAASTQSGPISAGITLVRLVATVDTRISTGPNPLATPSSTLLAAGSPEYFGVRPGWRVAALQQTGPGTLNITEAA